MDKKSLKILEFDKVLNKLSEFACSELGKQLAKTLLPKTDYHQIKEELRQTNDAINVMSKKSAPELHRIHDITDFLERAKLAAILSPRELLQVNDILKTSRELKKYIDSTSKIEENIIYVLIQHLHTNYLLEELIDSCILNEQELNDHASPELARIRRNIDRLQLSIKSRLIDIVKSSRYQKFIQDSVVTIREGRYVIPVKQEYRTEIPGLVHDVSASGATVFIEPAFTVEMNNQVKQLKIKEQLEIEKILIEITQKVAEDADPLISSVSQLAQIDFIFARAKYSIYYDGVCPKLNTRKRTVLLGARHPLLDQKKVVPIDFWIGDQYDSMVITGPNTGGKTVCLKTVGLFTAMAQSGLHVPSGEGTEIGVFEKIFSDIGDEQSIEQSLSTFSSHMLNIIDILNHVNDGSLVLLDELGAGTDPTEGAALAISIIESLREKGAITVATTHYKELKIYAVTGTRIENACCEFDVETLNPTYKLMIGTPGKSNAFDIASKLGLPENVVDKAKEFLTKEDIRFEDMLMLIQKNLNETTELRRKISESEHEINEAKKNIEFEKEKLNLDKQRILDEASQKARNILVDAKSKAEWALKEIERAHKEAERVEASNTIREKRLELDRSIKGIENPLLKELGAKGEKNEPDEKFEVGDEVIIINLNQRATVLAAAGKHGDVLIQAGSMKMKIYGSNLRRLKRDERRKIEAASSSKIVRNFRTNNLPREINVIGFNVSDAVQAIDKYIDDAVLARIKDIMVVHGKGTGALREGVHEFLKNDARVRDFRLGKYNEGGIGVTVVILT